jgi:dihydrofolate reductase
MTISAIVAIAHNNVIGNDDNQIPWYLPADLAYFKRTTMGCPVIMGRNTFHSIGRPLPKRTNIVITRDPFFRADGIVVAHSLREAIDFAFEAGADEAFIIGGGQIYAQSAALWDRVYLTEVDLEVDGTVHFPELAADEWHEVSREAHLADEKNEYNYVFRVLART